MLFWVLFFKKDTCRPAIIDGLERWSIQWIKSEIWHYYSFCRTNFSKLISFIKYKYHFQNIDSLVELPFYGQICVLVNKGHKILDLRRKVAIKVYRNDVDISTITNELERLKNGSLFDFAPSIRKWNIEERWYEEDYIGGSLDYSFKPRNSSDLLKKFYKDIVPCLENLMVRRAPVMTNLVNYISEIKSILVDGDLIRQELDVEKVEKIRNFIHSVVMRLRSGGNLPVLLVLTHGDFCPANMLNTKYGLRVVDWESASYRSALFDFYSYFFYRAVHQKLPLDQLNSEINVALPIFISKLDLIAPDVSESLRSLKNIYRWLYYIERVYMLIQRERYDTKLDVIAIILRFIYVFEHYEEISEYKHTEKFNSSNYENLHTH
jgi:hypothetical protein